MNELYLKGEGNWPWQEFYKNYYQEAETGKSRQPGVSLDAHFYVHAPEWVRWETANRLAYAEYRPKIIEALRDLPVSVMEDNRWTWLREGQSERPDGKAQYKKTFGFLLSFNDQFKLQPEVLLPTMRDVCLSTDPRADRDITEILEDEGHHIADGGYRWTKTGFALSVWSKKQVETLRKFFADCLTDVRKESTSQGPCWILGVDFPK